MNSAYYDMIFKRKSFHNFDKAGDEKLTAEELKDIERAWESFESLYPDMRTAIRIVPTENIKPYKNGEYCVLLYSEKKDNYLLNAGYMGQQLDYYLVSKKIGSLWYGFGKADMPEYDGLTFTIMFAIRKVSDETLYRKDMFAAKRKPLDEIWNGPELDIANIARFAPSACNSQPWYVDNTGDTLTVYRKRNAGIVGLVSQTALIYFNRIDIGIYLCTLEICMAKQGLPYDRKLFVDDGGKAEKIKVAEYSFAEN